MLSSSQSFRPLREQYQMARDDRSVEVFFERLHARVYKHYQKLRAPNPEHPLMMPEQARIFWESGRMHPGFPYFFVKHAGTLGWLFCRSGKGWNVARCDKIVSQDLFLRKESLWDMISLYEYKHDSRHVRVASMRLDGDLISYFVYEQLVLRDVYHPS